MQEQQALQAELVDGLHQEVRGAVSIQGQVVRLGQAHKHQGREHLRGHDLRPEQEGQDHGFEERGDPVPQAERHRLGVLHAQRPCRPAHPDQVQAPGLCAVHPQHRLGGVRSEERTAIQ